MSDQDFVAYEKQSELKTVGKHEHQGWATRIKTSPTFAWITWMLNWWPIGDW